MIFQHIHPGLYLGDDQEYHLRIEGQAGWFTIQACAFPYHRKALGYFHEPPKDHPEAAYAYRKRRLILNLLDAPDPADIPRPPIDEALRVIDEQLRAGRQVYLHCNQGFSRSPSIALLFLAAKGLFGERDFETAEEVFRELYPFYRPNAGMRGFARSHYESYKQGIPRKGKS